MISIQLEIKHQPSVQDCRNTTDCRRQFVQTSDYQRHHSIIGEVKDKSHQPHIPSRDILKKADHCENEPRWIDHEIITDRIVFMHSIWYNQNVNVYIWVYSSRKSWRQSQVRCGTPPHKIPGFLKTLRDLKRPLRVRICTLITQLWVIYELNVKIRGCLIRGAMIRGFSSFLDGVSSNLSKINSKNSFDHLHQL